MHLCVLWPYLLSYHKKNPSTFPKNLTTFVLPGIGISRKNYPLVSTGCMYKCILDVSYRIIIKRTHLLCFWYLFIVHCTTIDMGMCIHYDMSLVFSRKYPERYGWAKQYFDFFEKGIILVLINKWKDEKKYSLCSQWNINQP